MAPRVDRVVSMSVQLIKFTCARRAQPGRRADQHAAIGEASSAMKKRGTELPFRVNLSISKVLDEPIPFAKVKPVLQQARLRIRFLPLFVLELSNPEYQVVSRFI